MNYFELFEIPVQLKVDKSALPKKYFELQRKYHPDFFTQSTGEEQAEVLEKSSMINKAWKTFSNEDENIKYVLQMKGLLEEEEKYQLPNDFLMEVLEINERLMDISPGTMEETKNDIRDSISGIQNSIYAPVKEIVEDYHEGITTEKELLQVKEYYYKKKYLLRIAEQLNGMQ